MEIMAFLVSRNCKWKIHTDHLILQLQSYRLCSSQSLSVTRDDEKKAIEKVKVMVKSNKDGSFRCIENLWKVFFAAPYKWHDYRMNKRNQKAPDFKHIETGMLLWLSSNKTPDWVESKLNSLGKEPFVASQSLEQLWISFFVDPTKWFDHRKVKKSNKHPDFLHKYTREALWIEGNHVPTWVALALKNLPDERFETSETRINLWRNLFADPSNWSDDTKVKKAITHLNFVHKDTCEALWKALFADPSNWLDYRKNKKNKGFPDFKHKQSGETLWIDSKGTPSWVLHKLNSLQTEAFTSFSSLEDLWTSFFLDQSKWIDYRGIKKSISHPDFVRKYTSEALWIDDSETPAWATFMLNNLQTKSFAPSLSIEDVWKALFDDPSQWFDNRRSKKINEYPDFKHTNTREALWLDDRRTPAWVCLRLKDLRYEAFACQGEILASYEVKWKTFFASPSNWFDNRKRKITPITPDFRHKETKEGLWIVSHLTPDWVVPSLKRLENEAVASSITKNQ